MNGAQTTGVVHKAGRDQASNVVVLAKVIVVDDKSLIPIVVSGNNTQNSIVSWDRRSNDSVQIRLRKELLSHGVTYVHRRDSTHNSTKFMFAEHIGQMLCAFGGDLQTAIRAKADIFESDNTYGRVFPTDISIGHIFAVQCLGWAYDLVKQDLKSRFARGGMTEIQQKQLNLLNFPASKQFMVALVGSLREEIADARVATAQAFELKPEAITGGGGVATDAWVNVLRAILPTVVESLPAGADEYQVVRSSDHLATVVSRTKGVVAGAEALKDGFAGMRALLKPA